MRRFLPALAVSLLALWGCEVGESGLAAVEAPPAGRLRSEAAARRGRALYLRHCALCHGERADGRGVRRNLSSRARDFTDPSWAERTTPEEIFRVIREGKRGTAMAGWKILDESQTWDLVAYLLSVSASDP